MPRGDDGTDPVTTPAPRQIFKPGGSPLTPQQVSNQVFRLRSGEIVNNPEDIAAILEEAKTGNFSEQTLFEVALVYGPDFTMESLNAFVAIISTLRQ